MTPPRLAQRSFIPLRNEKTPERVKNSTALTNIAGRKAELRKAAEDFEAIFIRQMLRVMRSSIPGGGMFGGGTVGEIYGDMMDNSLGDVLSQRGVLGITDMLYRQLVTQLDQQGNETDTQQESVIESTASLQKTP